MVFAYVIQENLQKNIYIPLIPIWKMTEICIIPQKNKNVEGKSAVEFFPCCSNFSMSKTEQFLNLPLIESFRGAQEEEQTPPFSGVQNANASGS